MPTDAPHLYLLAYLTAINFFPEIYQHIPMSMETFMFLQHAFCFLAVHYLISTLVYIILSIQYRLTLQPQSYLNVAYSPKPNLPEPEKAEEDSNTGRFPVQIKEIQMIKSLVKNPDLLNDYTENGNPYIYSKSEGDLTIIFDNDTYQNATLKVKTPAYFSLYSFLFTNYKKTSYEWHIENMEPTENNKQTIIGKVYFKDSSTVIKFIHEYKLIHPTKSPSDNDIESISDSE